MTTLWQRNMGNHEESHDSPRSRRDALSKKCYGIHKTGQNKRRSHNKRTRDLWNTRRETQIQTKLDQLPWKNGQHQTPETCPQLRTSRTKRSWTPQETMAMRRCRNRSNDLIHGGRWITIIIIIIIIVMQFLFLTCRVNRQIVNCTNNNNNNNNKLRAYGVLKKWKW